MVEDIESKYDSRTIVCKCLSRSGREHCSCIPIWVSVWVLNHDLGQSRELMAFMRSASEHHEGPWVWNSRKDSLQLRSGLLPATPALGNQKSSNILICMLEEPHMIIFIPTDPVFHKQNVKHKSTSPRTLHISNYLPKVIFELQLPYIILTNT